MFNPQYPITMPSMVDFLHRHKEWSWHTFGSPAERHQQVGNMVDFNPVAGVVDHIKKELAEIMAKPKDTPEWFDVIHLASDGYLRSGGIIAEFMPGLFAKQRVNFNRNWPDWRNTKPGVAVEHERGYQD